jgi:hypothetical protein
MAAKKNPRDMTSDELIRHLFHPKVVKHVKAVVAEASKKSSKPSRKATK